VCRGGHGADHGRGTALLSKGILRVRSLQCVVCCGGPPTPTELTTDDRRCVPLLRGHRAGPNARGRAGRIPGRDAEREPRAGRAARARLQRLLRPPVARPTASLAGSLVQAHRPSAPAERAPSETGQPKRPSGCSGRRSRPWVSGGRAEKRLRRWVSRMGRAGRRGARMVVGWWGSGRRWSPRICPRWTCGDVFQCSYYVGIGGRCTWWRAPAQAPAAQNSTLAAGSTMPSRSVERSLSLSCSLARCPIIVSRCPMQCRARLT
jgi:hypothetical protein